MAYSSLPQASCEEVPAQTASRARREAVSANGIKNAKRDIVLAMLSVSLPMLALGGILIGLVMRYHLDQSGDWFFSVEHQNAKSDTSAFYLTMSATRFVTVASWIGNIAGSLSGLIMLMFSYNVARKFIQASAGKTDHTHCPTPFQLNLFLQARAGGVTSVWELMKYSIWKKRARAGFMLTHTATVLLITFAISYAIWGLDTWLHLSTTATLLTQSITDTTSYHNYSRYISCDPSVNTYNSCSTNDRGMARVTDALQILNNMSSVHVVSTYQHELSTFAYVTDAQIERGLSFAASTLGIDTQCTPISSSSCDLEIALDESRAYVILQTNCSGFTSAVWAPQKLRGINSSLVWLDQSDLDNAASIASATTNPFYFAVQTVAGSFDTILVYDDRARILNGAPDVPDFVGVALNCTSTVYDIQYRWINGSFFDMTSLSISNSTLGNTFSAPFQTGVGQSSVLNVAATAAGVSKMDLVADTFSTVFSKTAMSLGASVASPGANLGEGMIITGARVPKRPLIGLLAVVLLYAVWALVLGSLALLSRNSDVDDVQARLTIAGLAALSFEEPRTQQSVESIEDLFTEPVTGKSSMRLRMIRNDDLGSLEWRYTKSIDVGDEDQTVNSE